MEGRGIEWVLATAKCALFAVALAGVAALCSCQGPAYAEDATKHAGQPLDAEEYGSPTFADGDSAYLVVDRGCGKRWWLVQMRGQWVVLPLGQVGP